MKIPAKKLFLLDSLGALLSGFLLLFLVAGFERTFGMPQKVVYFLAAIAFLFAIHSFGCFLGSEKNGPNRLKVIGLANLLYCCLTLSLVFYYFPQLSILGVTYFILEMLVVTILAVIELKTAAPST